MDLTPIGRDHNTLESYVRIEVAGREILPEAVAYSRSPWRVFGWTDWYTMAVRAEVEDEADA
jgi:hypothetical protein